MFSHSQDKDVFRDNAFNRTNNVPSLSTRMNKPASSDRDAREHEVFSRLPSIPQILEHDKVREDARASPPYALNPGVKYSSEGASHLMMRSSMYVVPADEDLFELVGLPLLVSVQPFNSAVAIPEYRMDYLTKCTECSSFPTPMNDDTTYQYKCAMCGTMNKVQADCPSLLEYSTDYVCEGVHSKDRSWYSSSTLPKGNLQLPSCRKWNEPSVVFMIDCSMVSKNTAGYAEYINAMKNILLSKEFSLFYRRFAVVLVGENASVVSDGELGYTLNVMYNIKGECGLCAPLFIETDDLTEERVGQLMEIVESCSAPAFGMSSALTAAIQMAAYTGGCKVMAWLGGAEYGEVLESTTQTAIDCGMSLHVFCTAATKLEKLHRIVFSSGGTVEREHVYSGMLDKAHQEAFFRCSVRVVCSNGLKKRAIYSSGSSENISMISFPEMTQSTTFAVSFSVEDFLKEGTPVYIQAAIEYVNQAGENRVRVLNMKLRASRVIPQVFAGLSMDGMFSGVCKYICSEPVNMVENARKVESSMVHALTLYKRACAKDTSSTQLVLPDSIKGLPVIVQSIFKQPKIQLSYAMRTEFAGEVMPLPVDQTFRMFYPRLVKISSLFTVSSIDDLVAERLSMRVLDSDESYLMDAGERCILWFGKGAVDYIDEMVQNEVVLSAMERLKEMYGVQLKVTQCVQGEMDADFIGYMVEDQMGGYPKYQEYLGIIHGKITKK
ncbi:protein transport protein SEC24 [Nematocida major]|uniref:protein transport protein SEC24 n=1 Tax=Nematocida major TaxID=1912982 RepID=UPI002008286F|nr:protein transport protein SEC24 [Nematocida major]KAH9386786.1 protein transport protein SEC24 [Nematocida major]